MEFLYFIIGFYILIIFLLMPAIKDKILIQFLVAIPLINTIADVTTNYFPDGYITPGALRALLLIILLIILSGNIKYSRTTIFIFIFLFYLVFLLPLSSNSKHTFSELLKVVISLVMFPMGYYLLSQKKLIKRLNFFLMLSCIVIIVQSVISTIFKLGVSEYLEDSLYLGGGLVQITYTLALFVTISPVMFALIDNKKEKYLYYIIAISSIVLILLVLRRISIAALLVGYLIYFILSDRGLKVLKHGFVFILILAIFYPIFGDLFISRLQARKEAVPEVTQSGRVFETFLVINEILENTAKHALFGTDLFSSHTYGQNRRSFFIIGRGRQLHVDYNIILHGAGIIGFLLYILIHLSLFIEGYNMDDQHLLLYNEMRAIFWSIFFVTLTISFSGSISSVGFRSTAFLYMGAILGVLNSRKNESTDSL